MFNKLPTAWLQLSYYKSKLLVAIGGITFIISLIFMQLGFQDAFFDSAVRLPESIQGDIFLISSRSSSNSIVFLTNFSDRHLVRALAFPEVDYVTPIYTDFARWRNPQNKKLWRSIEIPLINDGTYGNYKQFLKILEMYLVSLGIEQAKQILLIADGAEWIWQHIPPLLNQLGCEKNTHYLLDFYHATEHLQRYADAAFYDEKERLTWFKAARSDLKKGKIYSLLKQMEQYKKSTRGQKRVILTSQINYFSKRATQSLFDYDKIAQLKLPIGSGAVESLIRQAVNLRLKGNGKFWLQANAEIILHARCQWLSGAWNNFTNSILTLRIYSATS